MADPRIISRILQLGKELGANISNSIGTRTNVSFLGTGPKDGMLFQKSIDPESFATIGVEKVLPDIESSIAYASGNKLNGFQLEQLEKNLLTMKETLNPTNVVDMGIDSLRAKSGIGERQLTEAASDVKSIDDAAAGVNAADAAADAEGLASLRDRTGDNNVPLRTLEEIMRNPRKMADEAAFPGETFKATNAEQINIRNQMKDMGVENMPPAPIGEGIMQTVAKADLPGKTGAAREFLVNALKKENPNQTSFADIVDPADMKFIMEGGGGAEADPIVLVQKYFGPRIAEMIPTGGSPEEIAIFTNRILNNVVDAKGLKPTDPEFDNLTARFIDEFTPPGGGQPFAKGGLAKILEL